MELDNLFLIGRLMLLYLKNILGNYSRIDISLFGLIDFQSLLLSDLIVCILLRWFFMMIYINKMLNNFLALLMLNLSFNFYKKFTFLYYKMKYLFQYFYIIKKSLLIWGLGIGDWGLGIGDWAQSPISPIPNPQSPIPNKI